MTSRRQLIGLGLDLGDDEARRVLLFRLLVASAHELRTRMDRLLAEAGLTTQQAMLLQVLEAQPAPPTIKELATRLAMSHQNLKQIALLLARKGLVRIATDPHDARVRRLHLTARHARLWKQRNPIDHAEVARWTATLGAGEVRATVAALGKLHAALMASRDDGG